MKKIFSLFLIFAIQFFFIKSDGDDWLHVEGNKIVDKGGKEVWLTGVMVWL